MEVMTLKEKAKYHDPLDTQHWDKKVISIWQMISRIHPITIFQTSAYQPKLHIKFMR